MEILNEMTLAGFWKEQQNKSFGIITAYRDDRIVVKDGKKISVRNTKEDKQRLNSFLSRDIYTRGFDDSIRLKGYFKENYGSDTERDVKEIAFVVFENEKGTEYLKKVLMKLGEKYDQDSILFKSSNDENAYLIGTSKREDSFPDYHDEVRLGKFHVGVLGEFYSRMRGIPFVFSDVLDNKTLRRKYFDRQDELSGVQLQRNPEEPEQVLEKLELIATKTIDRKGDKIMGTFVKEGKNNFERVLGILNEELITEARTFSNLSANKKFGLKFYTGKIPKNVLANIDSETAKDVKGIGISDNGDIIWVTEDSNPESDNAKWNQYPTSSAIKHKARGE